MRLSEQQYLEKYYWLLGLGWLFLRPFKLPSSLCVKAWHCLYIRDYVLYKINSLFIISSYRQYQSVVPRCALTSNNWLEHSPNVKFNFDLTCRRRMQSFGRFHSFSDLVRFCSCIDWDHRNNTKTTLHFSDSQFIILCLFCFWHSLGLLLAGVSSVRCVMCNAGGLAGSWLFWNMTPEAITIY